MVFDRLNNTKMYSVYILKSLGKNWFYIGLTHNLDSRLNQHNLGKVKSTKYNRPYKLISHNEFNNRIAARDFEKYLKVRSNKEKILRQLGYIL